MHRLWRDIDLAKRNAGLDSAPEPSPAAPWELATFAARLAGFADDAAGWIAGMAALRSTWGLVGTGTGLLRGLPVVGRWVGGVPTRLEPPAKR